MKLIQRTAQQQKLIEERSKWKRFGNAAGSSGAERGITMPSLDEVTILDPYSDEAKKTGEEKLIERIQQKIQESKKMKNQN